MYKILILTALAVTLTGSVLAKEKKKSSHSLFPEGVTQEENLKRMKSWDEAKFGMFIHWGLYSILGGEWQGKDYGTEKGHYGAEWIMYEAKSSKKDYAPLAAQFNPTKFNAEEWVLLAKNAGMKYINITAKHHDGFSLFDSKVTDFDVVDASPFKRDILKELAEACRKHDMKLGFYYSHNIDWWRRGLKKAGQLKKSPATPEYRNFVLAQLKELLTQYGDVACIWFDLGSDLDVEANRAYYDFVRNTQNACIISGRLQPNGNLTDYGTPSDRQIIRRKTKSYMEACMTTRLNWGYDKNDDTWPASSDMIRLLSLSVARHSNLLLNVGPKPDGTFCDEEIRILKDFAQWMAVNKEAIYSTTASPYWGDFPWGTITQKDKVLYLHILTETEGSITLPGILSGKVKSIKFLGQKNDLKFSQNNSTITITLAKQTSSDVEVIKVEFEDVPEIKERAQSKTHWFVPTRALKNIKNTYKDWQVK